MKATNTTRKVFRSIAALCWRSCTVALLLGAVVQRAQADTWSLTNIWFDTNGFSTSHLANASANRGIAYSSQLNQVFVSTRAGATTGSIDVFDGLTGAVLSGSTGVTGANLGIDQVGVADDGVLYGAPLNTAVSAGAPFQVYAWTNWSNNPVLCYNSTNASDPLVTLSIGTSKRVGDTLCVTGAGTNTLILAAIAGSSSFPNATNFVLLHTADGVNFSSTIVNVPGLPSIGGNILGITFYTNNTFLVQPGSGASSRNVYLVQFPSNFASQTSVTGTILGNAAGLSTTPDEFLNYSSAGKMLAAVNTGVTGTSPVSIFSTTNYPTSLSQLATANFATPNANGNATGGAALGGQGKTNYLYVLESNNGLLAYKINFSSSAVPPTLSGPTGAVSGVYPPQTLTITVTSGTSPFYYQWYVISGGTTNALPGANTNTYTVTTAGTNQYFVVVTNAALSGNIVTSSVVTMSLLPPVTNSVVTSLWSAPAGAYSGFLANNDSTRGLGYDSTLNRVVVATTTPRIDILDGNTGTNLGGLSMTGVSGGQFALDQVGVAGDGRVYGANLALAGQNFALYQWPGASNGAAVGSGGFLGDPGQDGNTERWGDNMAVRGAGASAQILVPSTATRICLFTTSDGMSFSPNSLTITGVPQGFAAKGVAFGISNTFWAKNYNGDLYEIAYDFGAQTNTVLFDYSKSGQIPAAMSGVAVDPTNNIFAGIDLADQNNDVRLYQLTGTPNAPVLFHEAFFSSFNANGNQNAVVVMKYPRLYAMDVNNGIVGLTYGIPATTPVSISQPPASQSVYAGAPTVTFTVGASGSLPLYYQWRFNGANIPNATNQTYSFTNATTNSAGSYDVVVHNIANSVTSTPSAVLTVVVPVLSTNYVSNLWALAPGSRPYLDSTTYLTRGLGYDSNSGTVLVCQTAPPAIYVLSAATGADVDQLNTAGLPAVGHAGFVLDQIGVADDGVVFGGNLAITSTSGEQFAIIGWTAPNSGAGLFQAYGPGDPGAGSGDRWGDDMAVRGAGVNTQILCGSYSGTNVALFTTSDGSDFSAKLLTLSDPTVTPGFAGLGIAFGPTNTFWAKGGHGYNLRFCSYDTTTGVITVLQTYTAGTQTPNDLVGLSYDVNAHVLAGVCLNDAPNDFQLFAAYGNSTPPALFNQSFFIANNGNSQDNAASSIKGGKGFALDANNGLVAVSYTLPPPPGTFLVTSIQLVAGPGVTLQWQSVPGATYQVQSAMTLVGPNNWQNVGSPVSAIGITTTFTDTSASASQPAAYYRVIGY